MIRINLNWCSGYRHPQMSSSCSAIAVLFSFGTLMPVKSMDHVAFLLSGRCCSFLWRCLLCHNLKGNTATNAWNTCTKSPRAEKWQILMLTSFIMFSYFKFQMCHGSNPCTLVMLKVQLPEQSEQSSALKSGLKKCLIIYEEQNSSNRGSY